MSDLDTPPSAHSHLSPSRWPADGVPLALWPCALLVCLLHGSLAWLGIELTRQAGSVAALWFPNVVAALILLGRRERDWAALLLAVAVGGTLANLLQGDPPMRSLVFVFGDTFEILLSAALLRRSGRLASALESVGGILRVELLGGVLPALGAATLATPLLLETGMADPARLWLGWLEASVIGSVSALPFGLLLLAQGWPATRRAVSAPKVLAAVLLSVLITLFAAAQLPQPHVYAIFGLVVAALVGKFPGAALAVLLNAVALLLPIGTQSPPLPADPWRAALGVLPIGLALVLPMVLAVTLERVGDHVRRLALREDDARQQYRKAPVMMLTVNSARQIIEASDAWLERMGYPRSAVIGASPDDFMTPETRQRVTEDIAPQLLRDHHLRDVEYQMVARDGEVVDLEVSAIGERNTRGDVVQVIAVFKDVSKQKRLAAELMREQERIAVTLKSIGDGVVTTDEHGNIRFLNPVAETLLGWTLAEARGQPFRTVVHLFDQGSGAALLDPVQECLEARRPVGLPISAVMRDRTGREYAVEDSIAPILSADGAVLGTVMVFQDVTEARQLASRMSHLALHDPLTDLPNRLLFHDRVLQLCQFSRRDGTRFAVMFIDLDHFKRVNDSLGHAVGDELLKTVARRLTQTLRASDTVCRLGGDEFVILVADIESRDAATEVARKVLADLAASCVLEGTDVRVSVSLGAAMFPDDGVDADTLMKRADAAMYRSKREGRNRYAFYARELDEPAAERLQLEADMRQAIVAGEFIVHYQPVVSAGKHAPVAVEALARWQRGALGLQLPERFISVAEESGMIVEMGASILNQACAQLGAWSGGVLGHVRMAVNVSALQLSDSSFVATVADALQRTGAPGKLLEIEITESTLMKDPDRALDVLLALKRLGVRIAIDDFGTGYSSLSSLKRFPVDTVKIDRSFVADLESDPDDRELVNAILAMSRSLRLDVVAEGVERDTQASILTAMKCPSLQGFLFAMPADAEHTTAWLSRRDAASRRTDSPQSSLFS